jgi:pSer/pThr/pTyr-binding forkhead associated (FHA) protein
MQGVRAADTAPQRSLRVFLASHRAVLVILDGAARGMELELDRPRVTLGRGPGVDFAFDDARMSRVHAALEFSGAGFRIRDLASRHGTQVDDVHVGLADLKGGEHIQAGRLAFQFQIDSRPRPSACAER